MRGSLGTGRCTVTSSTSGALRYQSQCSTSNCTAFSDGLEPSTATRIFILFWVGLAEAHLSIKLRECTPFAVAGVARASSALHHLHCAVLELRDLAVRVEYRVREEVRRRLVVAERDEDRAARRARVGARVERDLPAPGFDAEHFSGFDFELFEIERMKRGD